MKREVDDRTLLEEITETFCRVVERHSPYIIVSGFVAISHGRSRGTEDVDIIVDRLDGPAFASLHRALEGAGFECIQGKDPGELYQGYLIQQTSIRYVRKGTFVPEMEVKLAKDDLDDYQLRTRQKLPLSGTDLWFSSIEMNVAFKEELLRSDKDIADARHLRIVYEGKINEEEVHKIKRMIRRLRLHGSG